METLEFSKSGRRWRVEIHSPFDLAITMEFDGRQPRFFAASGAVAEPLRAGAFTGDVAAGASCMCGVYTLSPHCHGTHTECVGHLTGDGTHVAALTPIPPALAAVVTQAMLAGAAATWACDPWTALVVDLPSLDRADDGGGLIAHHTYWGLSRGVRDAQLARRRDALVTELAYIPAAATDGLYLLDLQVPAFGTDAAPSRPVIYPLLELAP